MKGVVYADTGTSQTFTTGMGMHGAAGEREIHNFCAATGPDFRRGFVDLNPTANTDITPTITQILGTLPNIGPGGIAPAGRAMAEALTDGRRSAGGSHTQTMTANLMLPGVEAVTTLRVSHGSATSHISTAQQSSTSHWAARRSSLIPSSHVGGGLGWRTFLRRDCLWRRRSEFCE